MKYAISTLAVLLLSAPSFAQKGFYLTGSAGAGIANAKRKHYNPNNAPDVLNQSGVLSSNAKVGIGYCYKNWRLETGIQYIRTGYQLNDLTFSSDFDPNKTLLTGSGKYRITYNHFGIPLQAGYAFALNKHLHFVPSLGVLTSYNAGASTLVKEGNAERKQTVAKKNFEDTYNNISFWGTAALRLEYKAGKRIGIFAGPSAQYMINSFYKEPTDHTIFTASQRNYGVNMDVGVNIIL